MPRVQSPASPDAPTGTSAERLALLALTIDQSQSLDLRYRLAQQIPLLLDDAHSPPVVAEAAGVTPEAVASARTAVRNHSAVHHELERLHKLGIWLVTAADYGYPPQLRELELPPPCLFCRSSFDPNQDDGLLGAPSIGIVGPRNADPYGHEAARWFATDLSAAGLVVTSGFARGVDGVAHGAAAQGGKPTIAVLGCGVDIPYPRQNQHLIEPILASGGMIVSEFPPGTPPAAWRFPVRNRLIAAQSLGMIVVQASPRSGSLISARLALECGRDVFAVPGRIFDQRSKGANQLLRDGAYVALTPESVLDTLPLSVQDELQRRKLGADGARRHDAVLTLLADHERTAEELVNALRVPLEVILQDLTEMELSGRVDRLRGGLFAKSKVG